MNGLELSRGYFEEYGKPMLYNEFPELLPYIAAGFTGSGSERYGFDDEISKDHDFEPGFCIFLPGEDKVDRRKAFLLERAYSKLPDEFLGIKRQKLSPVGGNRNGVFRTAEYYLSAVGSKSGELSPEEWLGIPLDVLAEAVNGEIFYDGYGEVTEIRKKLSSMPEDIRRKRIAGNLLVMAKSGQYNFSRCVKRGEHEAAYLAASDFVRATLRTVFLINKKYMPYDKWSFRALRNIKGAEEIANLLSFMIKSKDENTQAETIEKISLAVIEKLREEKLTSMTAKELEAHAYSVNDGISDGNIRNMNIFAGA